MLAYDLVDYLTSDSNYWEQNGHDSMAVDGFVVAAENKRIVLISS